MIAAPLLALPLLCAAVLVAGEAPAFVPSRDPARITGRADRVLDFRLQGAVPQAGGGPAVLRVFFRGDTIENAWVQADRADGVVVREMTFNDGVQVRGQDPARLPMPCWAELRIEEGRLRGPIWRVFEGRTMSLPMRVDIDLASGVGTWTGETGRTSQPTIDGAVARGAPVDPAQLGRDEDPLRPGHGWPQAKGVDGLGAAVPIERPVVAGLGDARFVWKSQARLPFFYCGASSPVADGDLVVVTWYQPSGTLTFTSGGRKFSAEQPAGPVPYDWRQRLLVQADDVVVGIDARSGLTRWRTELPLRAVNWQGDQKSMPGNTGAISDGRVFVAGFGGQVYALDAGTGAVLWEADLGRASEAWRAAAGVAIKGRSAGATPPKGGKGLGHSDGPGLAKPVVVGDTVLFNAGSRHVAAFAAASGQPRWSDPDACFGWRGFVRVLRRPDGRTLVAYARTPRGAPATFALADPRTGERVAEHPLPFAADSSGVWLVWRDLLVHVNRQPIEAGARARAWRITDSGLVPAFDTTTPGCANAASLPIVDGTTLLFGGHRRNVIPAIELPSGRLLGALTSPNGQDSYHELSAGWGHVVRPSFSWAQVAIAPDQKPPLLETSVLLEYGYDSAAMDVALADGRAFFRSGGGVVCFDLRQPQAAR